MQGPATGIPTEAIVQTRVVMLWKGVEYAGLATFLVVVPRLMGPTTYGRFAALVSLLTLMTSVSGLGGLVTFGRFLPAYELAGQKRESRALFVQLFWTRTGMAALMALGLVGLLPSLLPGLSPLGVGVAGASLLAGSVATTCFQVFYGLKRFGKWSCQDALTRITLLVFLGAFGAASSLDRAVLALGLTSLSFLALGLFWTQDLFRGERTPFNLASLLALLRFGLTVFIANLILATVWRAGEPAILLLSGQPSEAAYFNIANAAVTSVGFLVIQVVVVMTPSFTSLHVSGQRDALNSSMGYLLKYLTIASLLAILLSYAAASSLIVWILGSPYAAAAVNLKILVLGLPGVVLIALGLSQAIVWQQPGKALTINGVALFVFAASTLVLTPRTASLGTSIAVTLAMICGGAAACRVCSLAPALRVARFGTLVLLGGISLAVYALPWMPAPMSGTLAVALFAGLLFGSRVLHIAEIRDITRGLRGRRDAHADEEPMRIP